MAGLNDPDDKPIEINFITPRDDTCWPPEPFEKLPARHVSGDQYQLLETPFFTKEVARGDIVAVVKDKGQMWADHLVKEGGHSAVQIALHALSERRWLQESVEALGCVFFSGWRKRLFAVDVPPEVNHRLLRDFLLEGKARNAWGIQEGALTAKHRKEAEA